MGTLMAALVKYANSDTTKDPVSDKEKATKGKKNGNGKGHQHNPENQGGNKCKSDEFVANTNAQVNNNRARVGNPLGQTGQVPPSSNY